MIEIKFYSILYFILLLMIGQLYAGYLNHIYAYFVNKILLNIDYYKQHPFYCRYSSLTAILDELLSIALAKKSHDQASSELTDQPVSYAAPVTHTGNNNQ